MTLCLNGEVGAASSSSQPPPSLVFTSSRLTQEPITVVTLPSLLLSTPTAVSSHVAAFLSNCNSISPFLPIAVGAHPHVGCDVCPAHPPLVNVQQQVLPPYNRDSGSQSVNHNFPTPKWSENKEVFNKSGSRSLGSTMCSDI